MKVDSSGQFVWNRVLLTPEMGVLWVDLSNWKMTLSFFGILADYVGTHTQLSISFKWFYFSSKISKQRTRQCKQETKIPKFIITFFKVRDLSYILITYHRHQPMKSNEKIVINLLYGNHIWFWGISTMSTTIITVIIIITASLSAILALWEVTAASKTFIFLVKVVDNIRLISIVPTKASSLFLNMIIP